jgi:hypothetical protein
MVRQTEVGRRRADAFKLATEGLEVPRLDVAAIAVERVLGPGGGLPLIAPHDVETGSVEGEMEASDPRE